MSGVSKNAIPFWPHWQACSAVGCASRAAEGLPLQPQFMDSVTNSVRHTCTASCAASLPACHIPVASVAKLVYAPLQPS